MRIRNKTPMDYHNAESPNKMLDDLEAKHGSNESAGSGGVGQYLRTRRRTIEASIAAEKLAGNKWKEECERTALAEITALEIWMSKSQSQPNALDQARHE